MKLIYCTNSFPYGLGEQWKANELKQLVNYFDEITVVPFHYDGNFTNPQPQIKGVTYLKPLFQSSSLTVSKSDLVSFLFNRHVWIFLKEFFNKKVFSSKAKLTSWAVATKRSQLLLAHPVMSKLISDADKQTVFYFYWGKGSCEIMPFINPEKICKSFIRMHRYDLFEYVNDGYIPYRTAQLKNVTVAAPSSVAGVEHLQKLYPAFKHKIQVFRCGTVGNGKKSTASSDSILRVVSCSLLSPVKRVHLMIEALQFIDFPIKWHHIGDGVLYDELVALAQQLNVADKFIFEGRIDSKKILDFYTAGTFDVFVNVSESEGVPFSIMEAFSAAIPVIATNVGGTGEMVIPGTGLLVDKDVSAKELAAAISKFYHFTNEEKGALRNKCTEEYINKWNAEKLAKDLGEYLVK